MGGRRRRGLADLIGEMGAAPQEHEGEGRGRESTVTEATPQTPEEARLRGDQVDSLASLARRITRQKPARGGERITENTLIRVAVDWLLAQEPYIGGSSEEEIRRRLGVPEPGAGAST